MGSAKKKCLKKQLSELIPDAKIVVCLSQKKQKKTLNEHKIINQKSKQSPKESPTRNNTINFVRGGKQWKTLWKNQTAKREEPALDA